LYKILISGKGIEFLLIKKFEKINDSPYPLSGWSIDTYSQNLKVWLFEYSKVL